MRSIFTLLDNLSCEVVQAGLISLTLARFNSWPQHFLMTKEKICFGVIAIIVSVLYFTFFTYTKNNITTNEKEVLVALIDLHKLVAVQIDKITQNLELMCLELETIEKCFKQVVEVIQPVLSIRDSMELQYYVNSLNMDIETMLKCSQEYKNICIIKGKPDEEYLKLLEIVKDSIYQTINQRITTLEDFKHLTN